VSTAVCGRVLRLLSQIGQLRSSHCKSASRVADIASRLQCAQSSHSFSEAVGRTAAEAAGHEYPLPCGQINILFTATK
jgi:hypothetical protein